MSKTGLGVLVVGGGVGGLGSASPLPGRPSGDAPRARPSRPPPTPARRSAPNGAGRRSRTRPTGSSRPGGAARPVPGRPGRPPGARLHHDVDDRQPRRASAGRRGPGRADRAAHDARLGPAPGGPGPVRRRGQDRRRGHGPDGRPCPAWLRAAGRPGCACGTAASSRPTSSWWPEGGARPCPPGWRTPGSRIPEEVVESGLMYFTRWYRFPEGPQSPGPQAGRRPRLPEVPRRPRRRRDVVGDAGRGHPRRRAAGRPGRRRPVRPGLPAVPGPDGFFADGRSTLTGVKPMGGLLNRLRRFVDDGGRPLVLGVHAVGDAHTCTNPLYGRGCTLAMVQAVLLADALADHRRRRPSRGLRGRSAEVEPWYHSALELDRAGADPTGRGRGDWPGPSRAGPWPRCSSPRPPTP